MLGLRRALGCPSLFTQPPHITLVPPVNVRVEDIDQVLESTRLVCARNSPMRVRLGPIRTFAPVSPVLYLAVEGDDAARIETVRSSVFTGPLLRKVSYSYIPHCTIHEDAPPELIAAGLVSMAEFRRVVDLRSVEILRQDEDRVWRTLASFPLGPSAVRGRGGIEVSFCSSDAVNPGSVDLLAERDRRVGRRNWSIEARSADGAVIATANGVILDGVCTVNELTVDPASRGFGIGSHLLTEVLLRAAAEQADTIRLAEPSEAWIRAWLERRSFVSEPTHELVRADPGA